MDPQTWQRDFGQRLAQARANAGVTQTELGQHLGGLNKASISRIENGHQPISAPNLLTAAEHLNVDPTWLLTGNNQYERREP